MAEQTKKKAGAFDIRVVIAALVAIYGVVLTILGIIADPKEVDKAAGININLWGGIAMLVFAALFVLWARLRPTSYRSRRSTNNRFEPIQKPSVLLVKRHQETNHERFSDVCSQFLLPVLATGVAASTVVAGLAFAHDDHPATTGGRPSSTHVHPAADGKASTSTGYQTTSKAAAVFLAAGLAGRNEVPVAGGPAVDDPDGRATAVVKIKGDQVSYAVRWQNITAPKAFHIHQGAAGTNGGVKIDFLGSDIPAGVQAVTGSVKVTDQALLDAIKTNPNSFYLNLHTAEFPGGAVRGQTHALSRAVDLNGVLNGSTADTLQAVADGKQEVPGPKLSGDRDGRAEWLLQAAATRSPMRLSGAGSVRLPTGHPQRREGRQRPGRGRPLRRRGRSAHLGDRCRRDRHGRSGPGSQAQEQPGWVLHQPAHRRVQRWRGAGSARQEQQWSAASAAGRSSRWLADLQLHRAAGWRVRVRPFGVAAVLREGILHSFSRPVDGPPQWIAPDGTAVTGKLVTKSAERSRQHPRAAARREAGRWRQRCPRRHDADPAAQHRRRRRPDR